jgi:hypothetical protein
MKQSIIERAMLKRFNEQTMLQNSIAAAKSVQLSGGSRIDQDNAVLAARGVIKPTKKEIKVAQGNEKVRLSFYHGYPLS